MYLTLLLLPQLSRAAHADGDARVVVVSSSFHKLYGGAIDVDDSDVTLNLCLGTLFEGGDLLFSGRRCERHRQGPSPDSERRRVAHVPGAAILHAGADRHEALPLEGGRRLNLIVWCKSIHASGGLHPTWCPS